MEDTGRTCIIFKGKRCRLRRHANYVEFQLNQGSGPGEISRLKSRDNKVPRIYSIRRDRHTGAQGSRRVHTSISRTVGTTRRLHNRRVICDLKIISDYSSSSGVTRSYGNCDECAVSATHI